MAEEQNDPTKFDVGTIHRVYNKERDHHLSFGAYNGKIQISFGSTTFEKGQRPRSLMVDEMLRRNIIENMDLLINAPAPDKKFPLIINGKWNADAKKKELSCVFTIGMDENAMCYIAVKHIDDQNNTFSCKYILQGDRNVETVNYDDEKSRSIATLRAIRHMLAEVMPISALLTRNHLRKTTFQKGGGYKKNTSGSSSSESVNQPATTGEDYW